VLLSGRGPGSLFEGIALVISFWWFFVLLGGVPGVIYGLTFLPLCELSLRTARSPSYRDPWSTTFWGGAWLLAVSLASQLLLRRATPLGAFAAWTGLMLLTATLIADIQLVAWLRQLRRGETAWQLVPRDPNRRYADLLPLDRWVPPALCELVLVRPASAGDGPYRTAVREQEMALVPEEVDRLALESLGRTVLTLAIGACLLALL
jgi:hypothetical protein